MKIYGKEITVSIWYDGEGFDELSSSYVNITRKHRLGKLILDSWLDADVGDHICCGTRHSEYQGIISGIKSGDNRIFVSIRHPKEYKDILQLASHDSEKSNFDHYLAKGASAAFVDRGADVRYESGEDLLIKGAYADVILDKVTCPFEYQRLKDQERAEFKPFIGSLGPARELVLFKEPISPTTALGYFPDRGEEIEVQHKYNPLLVEHWDRKPSLYQVREMCKLLGLAKPFNEATHVDLSNMFAVPESPYELGGRLFQEEDEELFVWDDFDKKWCYPGADRPLLDVVKKST